MIWSYTVVDELEQAQWVSPRPALRPHLHSSIQITLVLDGKLGFRTPGGETIGSKGDILVILPNTLHQALMEPPSRGFGCNIYVTSPVSAFLPAGRNGAFRFRDAANKPWSDLISMACEITAVERVRGCDWSNLPLDIWMTSSPVSNAAAHLGMTREGFARAFDRTFGVSPKPFSLAVRLDGARRLLAQSSPTAEAAAALAFADQSHLGRMFKAAYGTTPGRYKETMGSNAGLQLA